MIFFLSNLQMHRLCSSQSSSDTDKTHNQQVWSLFDPFFVTVSLISIS